jgi:predicted permease
MIQDLRFGLKLLWKEKPFTITALLTLALCIGANTAIFSVLHAVVLEPLPFAEPERLVSIGNIYPGAGMTKAGDNSIPDYGDRLAMTDVFESVAIFTGTGYDAGTDGSPLRLEAGLVSPSYFRVLRASPMLGRVFQDDDAVFQKNQFVILSYGLWQEMFGRDPHAVGRDLRLGGVPHRIVGVMPQGFAGLRSEAKLWVPLTWRPEQATDEGRHNNNWDMVARLKAGVPIARAQSRIDAWNRHQIERSRIRTLLENARFASLVEGLREQMTASVRPTLYLLQGAVAFVLLIGCVNVANLMLVRSNVRMKELAIRHSLGAGRGRLAVQLLVESLMLAMLGGGLGILAGIGGVQLLARLGTSELPRAAGIHVNGSVLAFSAAIAAITGLVFGSVPVWHLVRRDLTGVFRSTERGGTTGKAALWTRSALVVCQVALAFILLIGSGLLTLSFARLLAVKPGFDAENLQTASFSLPRSRYADDAHLRNFLGALLAGLRGIPGVTAVGASSALPFSGNSNNSVAMVEGYVTAAGELPPVPHWSVIDEGYIATMRIPLLAGRYFNETDTPDKPLVAVVDEFLAKKYWPKGNAVGGKLRRGIDATDPLMTVVGVVASTKFEDLANKSTSGEVYRFYRQESSRSMHVVVRSASANPSALTAVRELLGKADKELALFDIKPMTDRLSASVRERRAAMVLCLVFAGLALGLSAIGIYGVLAYTVAHRTREFGIRMALGATAREVVAMVMRYGVRLAAIGLTFGIAGALAITRLMTTMLFDVKPADPLVFAAVAAGLMAVAIAASLAPSLRVTRIRPANALRHE